VFHVDSIPVSNISELLQQNLSPPLPLSLNFCLNPDNLIEGKIVITYDVVVELPDQRVKSFLGLSPALIKEIHFLDQKVSQYFSYMFLRFFYIVVDG
jgi:hypothetical protein